MSPNRKQISGITWMLCHCFFISVMSAMIRHISEKFHVFEIVFFHNIVAFLFVLPLVAKTGFVASIKTKKLPLHILRAVLGVVSFSIYFYALTVIPLTQARAIALSSPLISSLFAIFFLKEKSNLHKWVAIIIGFLGSLLILRPESSDFSYATLLVIAAVCMWSVIDMIMKILGSENTITQFFYFTGIMSLLSLPGALYYWQTPENLTEWLWLIGIGIVFVMNIIAIFQAFKYADVTTIMPFDFTGMVFTAIIAYFAFGEIIEPEVLIGGVIIVASSIYIIRKEFPKTKNNPVPEALVQE
jgi:hypothetical protein